MIETLIRENIKQMKAYQSARHDFIGMANISLDANEWPFDTNYNRYPDPYQKKLKVLLAERKGINTQNLFLANGSDEVLDLIMRLFCVPRKDNVIAMRPSYGMYTVLSAINNIELRNVPLQSDFSLDTERVLASIDKQTKIIFLCSPNNPTGNTMSKDALKVLLETNKIIVVDEAYIDFAQEDSAITLVDQYPNLIVVQTLSKSSGLAGLRIGMAIANSEIIAYLNKIKPPYNISTANIDEAIRVLNSNAYSRDLETILSQREFMVSALTALDCVVEVFPSKTNFLLVRFENSRVIYDYLKSQGIIVRDRSSELHCDSCLRITIGTPEENIELISQLKSIA